MEELGQVVRTLDHKLSRNTRGEDFRRANSQNFESQVRAERELVELRKSTTLDAWSVTNEPVADLPSVQLESKSQIDDLLALGEGKSKNEAGTHLYNYSKGFSLQSNGIDATEKSVQETARPQGDSSAGDVTMLGRIAAGKLTMVGRIRIRQRKGKEKNLLADEPGRVNINALGDVPMIGATLPGKRTVLGGTVNSDTPESAAAATGDAGKQYNNFSKEFGLQSNGIVAIEKSVQANDGLQRDNSAGNVNMLGRIATGQTDDVKSKSNQEVEGLERSNALADLGTRVESNRPEVFFDRTAGSESNRGEKPGAKADGETKDRFSASPSAGKSAEQSDFMARMDAGLPLTITPDAVAAQDKNPRLPAAEDNGARTIVGLAPGATSNNLFPFTTNLDAVFDNSNTIGAAPFGGMRFQTPSTGATTPSTALGLNSIQDVERPKVYQLQDERKAQNQLLGWADQSERFGNEQSLKQQSGDESSLLSNSAILKDAFERRERDVVEALRGVNEAVGADGTPHQWSPRCSNMESSK